MLQEDGVTVFPPIFETEAVMEPCLRTFRDENGVIRALCLVYVDDFMLACSDCPFGNMSLITLTVCTNGESGSHECSNTAAHTITQAYDKHTRTWSGFEISFTDYAKEISVITLISHRRRERKSQITPLELSQIRALNCQLLWLGMKCLPQLLATVGTITR